jgi:cytochrome c biogenesis factor
VTWSYYYFFGPLSVVLWLIGAFLILKKKDSSVYLIILGALVTLIFIIGLWTGLSRPPFRTMGETRLWYSLFLSLGGLIAFRRWKYPWLLAFSTVLSCVFALINILKPEIHSKALMPALLSPYFIPHVTLYILSYAILAASSVGSVIILIKRRKGEDDRGIWDLVDNFTYIGTGLLMLGLILGALWAKEAWGHYWSWDPKETWAFKQLLHFYSIYT